VNDKENILVELSFKGEIQVFCRGTERSTAISNKFLRFANFLPQLGNNRAGKMTIFDNFQRYGTLKGLLHEIFISVF
jgi:hypothetical protein